MKAAGWNTTHPFPWGDVPPPRKRPNIIYISWNSVSHSTILRATISTRVTTICNIASNGVALLPAICFPSCYPISFLKLNTTICFLLFISPLWEKVPKSCGLFFLPTSIYQTGTAILVARQWYHVKCFCAWLRRLKLLLTMLFATLRHLSALIKLREVGHTSKSHKTKIFCFHRQLS